ncbi:MAG: hypothetical protein ACK4GO_08530 [Gemmobacter sp.]
MKLRWFLKRVLAPAAMVVTMGTSAALAATLTFNGSDDSAFVVTDGRVVSGRCGPSGPECLALNNRSKTTTITAADGGVFSAVSFWFQLLGQGTNNTLFVESSGGGSVALDVATFGANNGGQVFSLANLAGFMNITSLTFQSSNGGNVRVDDVTLDSVSAVPLPASGLLLLGAFGLMAGAARRQRKA